MALEDLYWHSAIERGEPRRNQRPDSTETQRKDALVRLSEVAEDKPPTPVQHTLSPTAATPYRVVFVESEKAW